MTFLNRLREHRKIVYRLKRLFGQAITILQQDSVTKNLLTGSVTVNSTSISITRAVVLPNDATRLEGAGAVGNFNYGALYDKNSRFIMIDMSDLPSSYTIDKDDKITFNSKTYEIKSFEEIENTKILLINVTHVEGA